MRPIRAKKPPIPQVGQKWLDAVLLALVPLACSSFLLSLEGSALLCSVGFFGDEISPRGTVRGDRNSQDSVLTLRSFKETFRVSLNRFPCPPWLCACPHRVASCSQNAIVWHVRNMISPARW